MSQQSWLLRTEAEWTMVAEFCTRILDGRNLIFLEGPLGAGKTTFVRAILKQLNYDQVSSPTFAFHHEYTTYSMVVDHLDLYRIESVDQWESTGLGELFLKPQGLILVEWASRLPKHIWPDAWMKNQITIARQTRGGHEERQVSWDQFT